MDDAAPGIWRDADPSNQPVERAERQRCRAQRASVPPSQRPPPRITLPTNSSASRGVSGEPQATTLHHPSSRPEMMMPHMLPDISSTDRFPFAADLHVTILTDDARYAAMLARDPTYDGVYHWPTAVRCRMMPGVSARCLIRSRCRKVHGDIVRGATGAARSARRDTPTLSRHATVGAVRECARGGARLGARTRGHVGMGT